MRRSVLMALGTLVCLASAGRAATTIDAGIHSIPDVPGFYAIDILADGGDTVDGVNLTLAIGGGGSLVVGGVDGPTMTDIDLTVASDLIFEPDNIGETPLSSLGQLYGSSTMTAEGIVVAQGILAHVTIDTTGFSASSPGDLGPGWWSFKVSGLPDIVFPESDWNDSATPILIDGSIRIVPEPASIVLCLSGAAGLAALAIRRRRLRRGA